MDTTPTRGAAPRPAGQSQPARRGRLLAVPVVGLLVLTCVVLLAWAVTTDPWWLQPFNLTMFWWPLLGVPLVLLASLRRRADLAAMALVPVLAWGWIHGGTWLHRAPTVAQDAASLSVLSYNTWVNSPDVSHVQSAVAEADVDVLVAQEVFPSREVELREALGDRLPHDEATHSEGVGGVMVMSRHEITDVQVVEEVEGARRALVVVLDVDGQRVQVAGVHLRSPCLACGPTIPQRLEMEGDSRQAEVEAVLAALAPDLPTIVAGDLNSTARSMPYRLLAAAGFRDPQWEVGGGPGWTWPVRGSIAPVVRIDWILARGLEPMEAGVLDVSGADHLPAFARLALPAAAQEGA